MWWAAIRTIGFLAAQQARAAAGVGLRVGTLGPAMRLATGFLLAKAKLRYIKLTYMGTPTAVLTGNS